MFIDTTKFKKVLKTSCDGVGAEITHYANDLIRIHGAGWIMEIHEDDITNKCMAALVEYFKQLPRVGKVYEYKDKIKNETALEYDDLEPETMLLEKYVKAIKEGAAVQETRIMIQWYESCYSVYQTLNGLEPLLLHRRLRDIVDPYKIDEKNGELPPQKPVFADGMIIYNNDTMQLALATTPVHNCGERDFLRLINEKNMSWEFED